MKKTLISKNLSPALVMLIGSIISIMAFFIFRNGELKSIKESFFHHSEDRFRAIEMSVSASIQELERLELLLNSIDDIGRKDFSVYTKYILRYPKVISSLKWIPSYQEDKNGTNEEVVMKGTEVKGEYFPITYIEPFDKNKSLMGFNMASDPGSLKALRRSRDTGQITVTPEIEHVYNSAEANRFMIFAPIYNMDHFPWTLEERRSRLKGFVAGSFRIDQMVKRSFEALSPKGLNVYLYELLASGDLKQLYPHSSRISGDKASADYNMENTPPYGLEAKHTFTVAGRKWLVKTRPVKQYYSHVVDWHAWVVMISGMIFSLLVAILIKNSVTYAGKMESFTDKIIAEDLMRKVAEKALRSSKEKLRRLTEELHSLTIDMSLLEEKERKVLSEKLHEDIGQNLAMINLNFSSLISKYEFDEVTQEGLVKETEELIRRTITATRKLNSRLYPALPSGTAVPDAVKWYAETFLKEDEIRVIYTLGDGLDSIPNESKELLLRIARELLQNIMKHAGAKNVEVTINIDVESLELRIIDDGRGFSPEEMKYRQGRGIGLMLMRERIKHINGLLTIDSRPGKGTCVEVVIPL